MGGVLSRNDKGPDVGTLQQQLNCLGPTRLPRLDIDQGYGVLTMARVMEFQKQQGLSVDGAVGPNTAKKLSGKPTTCDKSDAPAGRCILVDLYGMKLTAFKDGKAELNISPIIGGRPKFPSHRGVFQMTSRRLRHHTSSAFPKPHDNMQFALFYNGGEAIHQGSPTTQSHACIHVAPGAAEHVFNWAGKEDVVVIIAKDAP